MLQGSPFPEVGHAYSQKPSVIWGFTPESYGTVKTFMDQISTIANVIPLSTKDDIFGNLNNSHLALILPGNGCDWLLSLLEALREKICRIPIVIFASITDPTWSASLYAAGVTCIIDHSQKLSQYIFALARKPRLTWPTIHDVVVSNNTQMKYRLRKLLGEGAYGYVFECADLFDQAFVMKLLKTEKPKSETWLEWRKETAFLMSLNHPNIVRMYDAFEYNGLYYMILHKANGSLRKLIEKERKGVGLDADSVIQIAGQILSGLDHIHKHGVIHRDLQIDNILYSWEKGEKQDRITVQITDFGISKVANSSPDHGLIAYTNIGREYDVAPELILHGYTTQQSDVYQLGLVLYYLYTGKHALGAADGQPGEAISKGCARERAESLGTPLGHVLAKMLRRRTEWRLGDSVACWQELLHVKALSNLEMIEK
eukprot:TRINITY_DN18342_c0_g1_i1.p1 TRINITY_DN18342_c0_g1~~TRINITY_DN18342_c0_g1_i1.p1  ORF type:complete len:428 (-),score=44.11 TRINITY_DN18342_c0_g1_i1:75-1358(-)